MGSRAFVVIFLSNEKKASLKKFDAGHLISSLSC